MTHHTSPLSTRRVARSFTAAVAVAAALCGLAVGSTWRDTAAVHAAGAAPAAAAPAAAPALPATSAGVSSYANVVDQVTPSVVTVRVAKKAQAANTALPFADPRFREFFGRDFNFGEGNERGGRMRVPRQEGLGSGVIINPAYRNPVKFEAATVGAIIRSRISCCCAGVSIRSSEYAPMPPVFGPWSPSYAAL